MFEQACTFKPALVGELKTAAAHREEQPSAIALATAPSISAQPVAFTEAPGAEVVAHADALSPLDVRETSPAATVLTAVHAVSQAAAVHRSCVSRGQQCSAVARLRCRDTRSQQPGMRCGLDCVRSQIDLAVQVIATTSAASTSAPAGRQPGTRSLAGELTSL